MWCNLTWKGIWWIILTNLPKYIHLIHWFRNMYWACCCIKHCPWELQLQNTIQIPLLLKLPYELMALSLIFMVPPNLLTQVRKALWCQFMTKVSGQVLLALTSWKNLYKLLNLFGCIFSHFKWGWLDDLKVSQLWSSFFIWNRISERDRW